MNQKLLALIITALLLPSFLIYGEDVPSWYLNPEKLGISSNTHFIGFGSGITKENSALNALNELASQFKISIESIHNQKSNHFQANDHFLQSQNNQSATQTKIESTLQGATILKQSILNSRYYTAISIKKKILKKQLLDTLNLTQEIINNEQKQLENYQKKENITQQITSLLTLKRYLTKYQETAQLLILTDSKYTSKPPGSISEINHQLNTLLENIQLTIIEGNQQTAEIGSSLGPIKATLFLKEKSKQIPIPFQPIKFTYPDTKITFSHNTDKEGVIIIAPLAYPTHKSSGTINISLITNDLSEQQQRKIPANLTKITYTPSLKNPILAHILVTGNMTPLLKPHIIREFRALNFQNTPNSPLVFEVTITSQKNNDINSINTGSFINFNLSLFATGPSIHLGSSPFNASGFGETKEIATKEAIKNIHLPTKEIFDFYQKYLNHLTNKE